MVGTKRLLHKGGSLVSPSGAALRPELVHAIGEATRDLPDGYRAEIFSAADARSTGTKNHPGGVALDLRIVDPSGQALSAAGFDAGLKIYEQLFQSTRIRAKYLFPGNNYTWIWGGAWISDAAGFGDRMHYQIHDPNRPVSGASTGSGSYNPVSGIDPSSDHASAFMSREELSAYQARVDSQARADYSGGLPTIPMTAAEALKNSGGETPGAVASPAQRLRMAKVIVAFEAQRDAQGHIKIYNPPANDGGGAYEIAGINVRYHPQQAQTLKALIEAGRHDEAEQSVIEYIAAYTDVVAGWSSDLGVESYLRDCAFNRGPTGAALILQRAAGVTEDGIVGPITRAAIATVPSAELLTRLRAARESYELTVAGRRENLWQGLVNRWDGALATARKFSAETPTQQEPDVNDLTDPKTSPKITIDIQQLLSLAIPLLLQLLANKNPTKEPDQSPIIDQPPVPPPVVVTPPKTTGFGTGILGLIITTALNAFGIIGSPIGPEATPTGQLLPALFGGVAALGATGAFGMWGSVLSSLFSAFKNAKSKA